MPGPFAFVRQAICAPLSWALPPRPWGGVFSDGGVEHGVELGDVGDLGVALLRDDEDGRGLVQIDALAKGLVGADLSGEEAVGVDDHGHHAAVRTESIFA